MFRSGLLALALLASWVINAQEAPPERVKTLPERGTDLPERVIELPEQAVQQWAGTWQAEGSLFTITLRREDERMWIEPLESLGFEWSSGEGIIQGDAASLEVNYQDVRATIAIELTDKRNAIVRATSCRPDYSVICALARDREARFIKITPAF